jgi:RNA polymerase sigma factor (sigma-70 family)
MKEITEDELLKIWHMVFNLSRQMLNNDDIAEEATQSIFEKVIKGYPSFNQQSKLSTWVYKISYNYLIDILRKEKVEEISFDLFENDITNFKPYQNELGLTTIEEKIYIEEIKVGCTIALLQCLSPQNRFIYIIGSIFDFPHNEAAEILSIDYSNYRKRLSRAKSKIKSFLNKNCGLINPNADCKCKKRILIAKERGRINPEKILYKTEK